MVSLLEQWFRLEVFEIQISVHSFYKILQTLVKTSFLRDCSACKDANIHKVRNVLIIFIRNPELGKVKTRLAKDFGAEKTLEIYLTLLEKTRHSAGNTQAERWLFYSEFIPEKDDWPESHFIKKLQPSGDLGQRMQHAFQLAFNEGAEKVAIIGSDCPELSAGIIQQSFDVLDQADYALGPTFDGGYYLLSMKNTTPELFQDMPWSSAEVFSLTQARIHALNRKVELLPMLSDVDEREDWERYLTFDDDF